MTRPSLGMRMRSWLTSRVRFDSLGSDLAHSGAHALVWVFALASGVTFLRLAARRLFHPLELDCIEGVMMDHVVRFAGGRPVYVEPSLEFIPLAYMPGFAWASSWLARAFGPELWEPRLLSLAAVLGLAALIARVVQRETGSLSLGAGGAGVFLMGFGMTGNSYDVGRPDSLMLLLAFGGLAALRWTDGLRGVLASAALLTLAFFTKQHAVLFVFAGLLYLVFNDRRRARMFAVSCLVGCAGGYAVMAAALGPWFSFYTWDVPSSWSQFSPVRILDYLGDTLFGRIGLLAGATGIAMGLTRTLWKGGASIWLWAGLGAIGTGLMATLDPYAYQHVLMGTIAGLAVLGPIAMQRLASQAVAPTIATPRTAMTAMLALLALQFVPLLYGAADRMPRARADEARSVFLNELREQEGDVLVPYHGFYGWKAGKKSSMHFLALDDLTRGRNRLLERDPEFFERMFATLCSGPDRPIIVTDQPLSESGPLWASLESCYELAGDLGWMSESLRPVTGNPFTPTYVYVPRDRAGRVPARFSIEWAARFRSDV